MRFSRRSKFRKSMSPKSARAIPPTGFHLAMLSGLWYLGSLIARSQARQKPREEAMSCIVIELSIAGMGNISRMHCSAKVTASRTIVSPKRFHDEFFS